MQIDLGSLGWIAALIAALIGAGALKSRSNASAKAKEYERRVDAINNAKEISREVDQKTDDGLLSEFDRLRDIRRKKSG